MLEVPDGDSALSDLLLQACHDLRGPLRAVRIHSELLVRNDATGQSPASLPLVIDSAIAAGKVVDGLTDYALALAIDPARFQLAPLGVLVRTAIAKVFPKEQDAEILCDEFPSVKGDFDRLIQLFEYLLDRAQRSHGSEPLKIRISTELADGMWWITIQDNGKGLDPESVPKAFAPFVRLDANQRPGPGLAVCRVIAEKHGGSISVESDGQTGCTFRVALPAD